MNKLFNILRNSLVVMTAVGALAFGGAQTFAGTQVEEARGTCNAWACRAECPDFGGQLGPGGPGKPLKCFCCG